MLARAANETVEIGGGKRGVGDINLNGSNDGVRMTWPRAAVLAIALLVAGGTWAGIGFQRRDRQRAQEATDRKIDKLTGAVDDLTRASLLATPQPPRIDSQGRILK